MKVNYKPSGPSRMNSPKQWEVWLADTTFGTTGKKRCSVLVGKRTPAGYTVYEIIPLSAKGPKDVPLSDFDRAGQDRPAAIRVTATDTIQNAAFVQKLGSITDAEISKVISSRQG